MIRTMAVIGINAMGASIGRHIGQPAQGLDVKQVAHVINACSGRNRMSGDPAGPCAVFALMVRDPFAFASLLASLRKDVGLAANLSGHVDGDYPAIANWRPVAGDSRLP